MKHQSCQERQFMRLPRSSIAGLMGLVLALAIGFATIRGPTEVWAGDTHLVTCALFSLAIVGAVVRQGAKHAWWLGFALFGLGYMTLAFRARDLSSWRTKLPTTTALEHVGARL